MALIVGIDSYISVAAADQYVQSHYLSTSPERIAWEALTEPDKEVLLRNSTSAIDSLPLVGRKADINQALAFPRVVPIFDSCRSCCLELSDIAIPNEVLWAQVEQALYIHAYGADDSSATRARLQQQGVKSYSIGDLSETFGDGVSGSFIYSTRQCSEKVLGLMSAWLGGGYRVCP